MNYATLTLNELKHYAALNARTPLEIALSNALRDFKPAKDELESALADLDEAKSFVSHAINRLESVID